MTSTITSNEKLHEALALLNEAAKERREELQKMVAERYTNVKSMLAGATHTSGDWLKEQSRAAADKAKEAASTVDESVRKHPWPYIGGTAFGALILGFMLGRRR